jgi:adenylate cyclase
MNRGSVERRLAAILAADVAGYSRLMGLDDEGTLVALKSHLAELVEPAIATHRGRVVKTTGDGLLAEFASVVDAMRAAVAIQSGMAARNADEDHEDRIRFRIGVNLGDVLADGGDIYGDGVNVAARLEALAEPGGICLSGAVHDQVQGRIDAIFEDWGRREVKNIATPVQVYRVVFEPGDAAIVAAPATPPDRPSVAVLPFANLSGDPEQEYFSDGITEDLITDLSKISGLFVIARNSVFAYKGRAVKVPDVCRELGVRHVLEGSVRKAGSRVRVTAQLIDGSTGGHIWAERYDRELADVFAVQDDLTREIVDALKVRLTPDEQARVGGADTENLEAYDLILRATEQHYRVTREANAVAKTLIERALALAPTYARAHALLALNHLQVASNSWVRDPRPSLDVAYASACRAVALDDALALAHHAKGFVALWLRRFDESIAEMATAIRLEPNDAVSHSIRAMILAWAGQPFDAIRSGETALRHDPIRSLSLFNAALAYFEAGHYDTALALLQRATVRRPDFLPNFAYLSATLAQLGRIDEAKEAMARALEINPALRQSVVRGLLPYRDPAALERLIDAAAKAGLPE